MNGRQLANFDVALWRRPSSLSLQVDDDPIGNNSRDAVRISGVTIDEARQLPQGAKRKGAPPNSIKIIIIIIIIIKFSFIRTRTIPSVTDAGGIYKK